MLIVLLCCRVMSEDGRGQRFDPYCSAHRAFPLLLSQEGLRLIPSFSPLSTAARCGLANPPLLPDVRSSCAVSSRSLRVSFPLYSLLSLLFLVFLNAR
jgi:hypothetical protein